MSQIDNEYRKVSAWGFFGLQILFAIPVIGFIALLICSFAPSNRTIKSYARSYFCILVVLLVIIVVTAIIGASSGLFEKISEFFSSLTTSI